MKKKMNFISEILSVIIFEVIFEDLASKLGLKNCPIFSTFNSFPSSLSVVTDDNKTKALFSESVN